MKVLFKHILSYTQQILKEYITKEFQNLKKNEKT